jgi:hypothetical protein
MENFSGVCRCLDVNCAMVKRALCVALGLLGSLFPAGAQQANRPGALKPLPPGGLLDSPLALSLYRAKMLSAADRPLLFHKGRVMPWSDGGWLASENSLAEIGMASLDLFPAAFLPPVFEGVSAPKGNRDFRSEKSSLDGKDSAGEIMEPSLDRIYYGGEVGFLYGRWSGKGGGDMWETYVVGTVGNDKFQITAGAAFDKWNGNGRGLRFRSFAAPR